MVPYPHHCRGFVLKSKPYFKTFHLYFIFWLKPHVANEKGNKPRRESVNREHELSSPHEKPARSGVTPGGQKLDLWPEKDFLKYINIFKNVMYIAFSISYVFLGIK